MCAHPPFRLLFQIANLSPAASGIKTPANRQAVLYVRQTASNHEVIFTHIVSTSRVDISTSTRKSIHFCPHQIALVRFFLKMSTVLFLFHSADEIEQDCAHSIALPTFSRVIWLRTQYRTLRLRITAQKKIITKLANASFRGTTYGFDFSACHYYGRRQGKRR